MLNLPRVTKDATGMRRLYNELLRDPIAGAMMALHAHMFANISTAALRSERSRMRAKHSH